jgi:hypothetical protein
MNKVPAMVGTIERRLLINYRVAAEALEGLLPSPFRPQLIDGVGMAGICLIRLGHLRPVGVPAALGVTSENAAHRIAVEWDGPDGRVSGVYIPRRDTSSQLTVLLGGRLFPGEHHRSHFQVSEAGTVPPRLRSGAVPRQIWGRAPSFRPWTQPRRSSRLGRSATRRRINRTASRVSSFIAPPGMSSPCSSSMPSRVSSKMSLCSRKALSSSTRPLSCGRLRRLGEPENL